MSAHMCREFNPACYRCDLNRDELPPPHECNADMFDRVVCASPCDTMHTYCSICHELADACALDAS